MALSVKTGNFGSGSTGGGLPAGFKKQSTVYSTGTNDTSLTFPINTNNLTQPFIIIITRISDEANYYNNVLQSFAFSCLSGTYEPTNTIIQYVARLERTGSLTQYNINRLYTNYQNKIRLEITNGIFDETSYACTVYSKG